MASLHIVYDCERVHTAGALSELKSAIRTLAKDYRLDHLTIELDPKGCSCGMESC